MPQKKNPDGAELVRAKSSLMIGNLSSILNILKGLPLSYSKDLQEDKKLIFDSYDNLILSLKIINEILFKSKFNQPKMKEVIDYSNSTATDLANWLVQNLNYTFRDAYKTTGMVVAYCNKKKLTLEKLTLKELQNFDKNINSTAKRLLSATNSVAIKSSYGGTAPKNTKKMIEFAIKKYLK